MNDLWSARGLSRLCIVLNVANFVLDSQEAGWCDKAFAATQNNSLKAMMVSMFTHANAEHLVGNMVSLFYTSLSVFINPPPRWNSPFAFLFICIPSGLAGFLGNSLVFSKMQGAHKKKREGQSLFRWVSGVWNGNEYRSFLERAVLSRNAVAKRIGASGAVYGLVGARIYTATWSPSHAPFNTNDLKTLFCALQEVTKSREAWSIDSLLTTETLVDHAAHLFGFVAGVATAWTWDKWSSWYRRRTVVEARLKKLQPSASRRQ